MLKNPIQVVGLFFLIVPQFFVKVPFAPEYVKTTDVAALGIVALAIFAIYRTREFARVQVLAISTVVLAVGSYCVLFLVSDKPSMYIDSFPYLARLFSIHAAVLLLLIVPKDQNTFSAWLLTYGALAVVAQACVMLGYVLGLEIFDAHQTLEAADGKRFHRLGGVVGETGAFAFNAVLVGQYLSVSLGFLRKQKAYMLWTFVLFPLFCYFVYRFSFSRISIITGGGYILGCLVFVPYAKLHVRAFVVVLGVCLSLSFFLVGSTKETLLQDGNASRMEMLFAARDINEVSSGRVGHWSNAISEFFSNSLYVAIGVGYRIPEPLLQHAVENFFLFHLLSFGVLGSVTFGLFYWRVFSRPMKGVLSKDVGIASFAWLVICAFIQWQVNDINLFYQAFPSLLFFASWLSMSSVEGS